MSNRPDPQAGYTRSAAQLSKEFLHNPLRSFLRDLAVRDRVVKSYDFKDRNEINDWTVAQTQTSTSFTAVTTEIVGVLQATTANTTTASISMIGKEPWAGNNNVTIEGRFKINTVASTFALEFGLIDAAPSTGAAFYTGFTGPTFVGTNGTLFAFDNSQAHTSFAFGSVGSFTSQTVVSTLITAATVNFTTPVADTYMTVKIQLLTNPQATSKTMMLGWINGKLVAQHVNSTAGYVNGSVNLFPWFYCKTVAAAVKIPTIDYCNLSMDRVALNALSE